MVISFYFRIAAPKKFGAFLFLNMENNPAVTPKKVAVTFTLPNPQGIVLDLKEKVLQLLSRVSVLAYSVYNPLRKSVPNELNIKHSFTFPKFSFNKFNFRNFDKKKLMKVGFPLVLGLIVIAGVVGLVKNLPDAKSSQSDVDSVQAPDALSTLNLNRQFSFPLRDEKGEKVGSFDYTIQSAAIQKQIIVQGQRATAVSGRSFLILNLKITNNLKKTIQINTRDYLRLTMASKLNEQLAPDIHNDPVEVQAISTKFTRVGIALDDQDTKKTINLKVGEIDGAKQSIDLDFQY